MIMIMIKIQGLFTWSIIISTELMEFHYENLEIDFPFKEGIMHTKTNRLF